MRIINANLGCKLVLGRQSENNRTQVVFDYSDMAAEFPGGLATIVARRPNDTSAHIVDGIVHEGTVAKWTVSDYELAQDGTGKVQLIYSVSNAVAKTKNWTTEIGESLTAVEGTPPEWMDMFNKLIQAAGEVHQVTEQMRTWRNETEALRDEAEEYCNRVIESESQVDTWHDEVLRAAIAVSDDKALVKQWRDETEQFDIGAERASYEAAHAEQAALASQVNAAHSEATAIAKATEAAESARLASLKAAEATEGATTVVNKTAQATNAAGTATAKAAEAALSATQASNSAVSAADSERGAIAKATEAAQSAQTATAKAKQATEAAQTATEKAGDASASARAAHASEISAAESADDALSAEVGANAAKRAAEASATQAGTSERNAGTAAQTAMQKAAEATQSATDAETFAGTATTKAEEAAASAQAAQDAQTAVEQTAEQLADSLEQIAQNTQDIAEHEQYAEATYATKTDLYKKADIIHNTASGAIASFPDGADGHPVDSLKVSIEPVQDLHGYDHPWPAGGGENLLYQPDAKTATHNGITWSANANGSITIAGTATADSLFYYIPNNDGVGPELNGNYRYRNFPFSDTSALSCGILIGDKWFSGYGNTTVSLNNASGQLHQLWYKVVSGTTINITIFPIIYKADATLTSWTPYSNICPISGFEELTVTRTGGNQLIDNPFTSPMMGVSCTLVSNDNSVSLSGTASQTIGFTTARADVKAGVTYTASVDGADSNCVVNLRAFKGSTFVTVLKAFTNSSTITFTPDGSYDIVDMRPTVPGGQTVNNRIIKYSLNIGETPAAYEPHQSTSLPISWQTEAGTVYGGELTVNADGSGSLVVDRATRTLDGTEPGWAINGSSDHPRRTYGYNKNASMGEILTTTEIVSSYVPSAIFKGNDEVEGIYVDAGYLWIRTAPMQGMTAVVNWTTYLSNNPLQVVYKLTTPLTYTLTASQIRTLLGQNNVWADAGDVSVKYNADTKLYIDGKIAELVAQIVNS